MTSSLIAIDGPSGSGKSTTARLVAERLGLAYLDTGAMYRAIATEYLRCGLDSTDSAGIIDLARSAHLGIETSPVSPRFAVNGRDVTHAIREPEVSACVSVVATNQAVRDDLTERMRRIINDHARRIVVEGRDITTVVAPDADVRVLLVADPEARVARRKAELGEQVGHAAVTDQVLRRDRDDSTVSNFTEAAAGVHVIDSTFLTPGETADAVIALLPPE